MGITIIETHPVQYHAPVYRWLQQELGIPVTVIYGSDHSLKGYYDKDFQRYITWDTDLLSGYTSVFLSGAKKDSVVWSTVEDAIDQSFPDAVMIVGYSESLYRKAFFHCLRAGYPILFRAETLDIGRPSRIVRNAVREMLLKAWYSRCHKLLYIGEASRQHYERLKVDRSKLTFSPYCVDNSNFQTDEKIRIELRQQVRKDLNISHKAKVILFSGKLIPRKNPGIILDAIRSLSLKEKESVEVIFLGDGPLKRELRKKANQSPGIRCHFVGFQNQTWLSPYYHSADIMVLPSRYEAWGLVVNEALEHGVPCVVSDVIGCSGDLIEIGQTGGIFKEHSPVSLADSLKKVLFLADQPGIRDKCRKKVERYSVHRAAEGIAQAFKKYESPSSDPKKQIKSDSRVLIIGSSAGTSLEKMYLRAFKQLGFEQVDLFNTDPKTFTGLNRLFNPIFRHVQSHIVFNALIRFIRLQKQYDAVFIFKGMFLTPRLLCRLEKILRRTIWININPDDPFNIQSKGASNRNVLKSILFYDVYGIWSKSIFKKLKEYGCRKVVYLPFGYDSEYHRLPKKVCPPNETILFIGSWDKERERVLNDLSAFDLRIYGSNWDKLPLFSHLRKKVVGKEIFGEKLCEEVNRAAINLNLLRQQNLGAHNMRTFEIPAMGGFMLSTRTDEQLIYFREGLEAEYFSSSEELVRKVKYYLSHPDERIKLAREAYVRSQDLKATYQDRLQDLLKDLNI